MYTILKNYATTCIVNKKSYKLMTNYFIKEVQILDT